MTARDPHLQALGDLWEWFASSIEPGYCPVYVDIARAVADDDDLLDMARVSPPAAHNPPALLAAVHSLLLDGLEHPLAAVYRGDSDADPAALFRDLCLAHRDAVLAVLAVRRVQTNEVGRSALIGPALTWAARRVGPRLQLVDVGCSAGLNLLCDRYLLDYGEHGRTGPPDAAVRVACRVVGGDPPVAPHLPDIGSRVGIDLDPPDLHDPVDGRWLLACTWPGTDRMERTALALLEGAADPPDVRAGDALDLLPGVLGELGPEPVALVTTWSFSYLHPEQRVAFTALLEEAGRRRPLVWISADGRGVVELLDAPAVAPADGAPDGDVLGAVVFDGGAPEAVPLALAHPHGQWLDWRA